MPLATSEKVLLACAGVALLLVVVSAANDYTLAYPSTDTKKTLQDAGSSTDDSSSSVKWGTAKVGFGLSTAAAVLLLVGVGVAGAGKMKNF